MNTVDISFEVGFRVTIEERDGWFFATDTRGGSCNSNSEKDCVRILTERHKQNCAV